MCKDEIFRVIQKNIITVLPHITQDVITPDKELKDLGANSIDRSEIILKTLEDLNLKIPLTKIVKFKNIGALSEFIAHEK
ncbi:MAG: acyl carrier protein [Spirochaetales bacterium]|nr:acyl carrier protein [Spirochaetales bacterium]